MWSTIAISLFGNGKPGEVFLDFAENVCIEYSKSFAHSRESLLRYLKQKSGGPQGSLNLLLFEHVLPHILKAYFVVNKERHRVILF